MYSDITRQELFNACHLLFGHEVNVSSGFLEYLQLSGVKSAFRIKALETHPDRALALFGNAKDMEERFKALNNAYKQLSSYVEDPSRFKIKDEDFFAPARPRSPKHQAAAAERRHTGNRVQAGSYRSGRIPPIKLSLGRFLYYSGAISYENLISAIIWQRMQHLLVGKIAAKYGWLYEKDILHVIEHRLPGEKFGECAMRRGLMTSQRVNTVLGEQKRLRQPLGMYFTGRNILTHRELNSYLVMQYSHNKKHAL